MDATTSRRLILTFVISLAIYAMACFGPVAWSPDSQWIAFTTAKKTKPKMDITSQVWAWDIAKDSGRKLLEGWMLSSPAITPDGKQVICVECTREQIPPKKKGDPTLHPARLVSVTIETGQRAVVAQLPPMFADLYESKVESPSFHWHAPAISPDGKQVAFAVHEDAETNSLYLMDLASQEAKLLQKEAAYPRWSPDGKWLCFVRHHPAAKKTPEGNTVEAIEFGGSKRVNLGELCLPASQDRCQPFCWPNVSWAPNSKYVAYATAAPKENDQEFICVAGLDGTRSDHLRKGAHHLLSNPVWSPNGNQIAVRTLSLEDFRWDRLIARLVVIDRPSDKATVLAESWAGRDEIAEGLLTMPAWSPDGRWIAAQVLDTPTLFSADGAIRKYLIYDENSASIALTCQAMDIAGLQGDSRFSEARKQAQDTLRLTDEVLAKYKFADKETKESLLETKLLCLFTLNRFDEILEVGKGPGTPKSAEYITKAQLVLGHYDQVKEAPEAIKAAQELERNAAACARPAEAAKLWMDAGNVWYDKLLNRTNAIRAYENVIKAVPQTFEARLARDKIAEIEGILGK